MGIDYIIYLNNEGALLMRLKSKNVADHLWKIGKTTTLSQKSEIPIFPLGIIEQ